jgi:uncharacterized membrane protein (UPF0127 family)
MRILMGIEFLIIILLAACQENPERPKATSDTSFGFHLGEIKFNARIACNHTERQKGLMHIQNMPENDGMLFLFKQEGAQGFWMKNTLIPLDIGYFTTDYILREIHPMYPRNLDSVKSNRDDIQFALEMNQGWFRKNGIIPGTKLNLDDMVRALIARGEKPKDWIR